MDLTLKELLTLILAALPVMISVVGFLIKKGNAEREKTNAMFAELLKKMDNFVKIRECERDMQTHCDRLEKLEDRVTENEKQISALNTYHH